MKSKLFAFLSKHKILAFICSCIFLMVVILFWRLNLFLNNKCPSCGELLLLYTPQGYYDPIFKERMTFRKSKISFSFLVDKYGSYFIGLENMDEKEGAFHFSKDIGYRFSCESSESRQGLSNGDSSWYKKVFFREAKLLQIDAVSDSEKEKRRRWFFTPHSISFDRIPAFDTGDWVSGWSYDDIGRQYDCTVEFLMDEADFFEADLVVRRRPPH